MNISSKTPNHTIASKNRPYKTDLLKTLSRLLVTTCLLTPPQIGLALPYVDSAYTLQDNWNTITYARIVWPPEDSLEVVCSNFMDCDVAPCITDAPNSGKTCLTDMDSAKAFLLDGDTLKDARESWVKKYGVVSKEFRFNNKGLKNPCITMGAGTVGVRPLSGVICIPTQEPNVICTVSDKLDFVYNTLNSDQVHNAEAYGTLAVKCNSTATVNLRLVGPSEIDLGRGGTLRARLHIGGYSLANGYSLKAGSTTTSLTVTSVLQSSLQEAQTGTFKGEGIIIMNMQ